jgi:hypothetical protein
MKRNRYACRCWKRLWVNGATSLGGTASSSASMESSCEMQDGVVVMELDGKKTDAMWSCHGRQGHILHVLGRDNSVGEAETGLRLLNPRIR